MRAIFINEIQSFKRGRNPHATLGIGNERYTKDAYVYYLSGAKLKNYWITFPGINMTGKIGFAKIENGVTTFVNSYDEPTNGSISWLKFFGEEEKDKEIQRIAEDYFLENWEELMEKSIKK